MATAHRLPAPIVESEEKPTPTPEQSAKPKPKRASKPKTERASLPSPTPATSRKFAGKWVGTMPEVPWGNVVTELTVDENETMIQWHDKLDSKRLTAKATLNGGTLSARFPIGVTTAVWFITPAPDGLTADIRMTAFMNDDRAVFRRVSR
jgi:hypothetical protein